jgi:hypothetical protein
VHTGPASSLNVLLSENQPALFSLAVLLFASPASAQQAKLPAYTTSSPATDAGGHELTAAQAKKSSNLTTFMYTVHSSRDGNIYSGSMVGQDPFGAEFTTTVITASVQGKVPIDFMSTSLPSNRLQCEFSGLGCTEKYLMRNLQLSTPCKFFVTKESSLVA